MPVVTLYLQRLQNLVGKKATVEKIVKTLPFLGLDIEEQTSDYVRVEYSPNRPDYATDVGIAAGLQGLLGIKIGLQAITVKRSQKFSVKIDPSVRKIRQHISALVARGGKLDDEAIRQIIALQEDLHFGIGRRRKKSSIGIHNLDVISFPLLYTAKQRNHKFIPLGMSAEMSAEQILEQTDVGRNYGMIIEGSKVPMILDASASTISFPPIINSALTAISTSTTNLLVEVTGNDKNAVDDSLAVIASVLSGLGFDIFGVNVGQTSSSNIFKTRSIALDPSLVNQTLGLHLTAQQICAALKKCRLDAVARKKKIICTIPRFRFDIFGAMDLVEEVALGYGIQNLGPTLPASSSVGQKSPITIRTDLIGQIMVGLGFTEALNSGLTSRQILYERTKRDASDIIEVAESKSQEHTVLRDMLIPALLDTLSRNVHEPYPQKLFEIGTVFSSDTPIKESLNIACLSAHKDSGFTEIKSILQSLLKTDSNIECQTRTSESAMFAKGKTADIVVNGKKVGVVGQIDPQVAENFRIRVPVSGFEMTLTEFIL
ncbi:MAG: phenylalanine--tRNA ligase subunit beta [Candidatus Nitrosotenuis sp.]